jgi:hydroxymethylbilane synthase
MERIPKRNIVVATRLSMLAKMQTDLVCHALAHHSPDLSYEVLGVNTKGDMNVNSPLKDLGGKGIFVKELQEALLSYRADFAVHSMKDLPLDSIKGLTLAGLYSHGHSPFDVLVSAFGSWRDLPKGARIGSSSLRRAVQFLKLRSDCQILPLRGNVVTRLDRLSAGDFDGLILAESGLQRLCSGISYTRFSLQEMVPAFNQGVLGVECRTEDTWLQTQLQSFSSKSLQIRVQWEREISDLLGASCKSAIGIYAEVLREDPLKVRLSVFACKDWDQMQMHSEVFSSLTEAITSIRIKFDCENLSWALCHIVFT